MNTLTEIYRSLETDMVKIEHGLEESIDVDVPLLYETSTHLLKAGGKRIRPIFVLLSGKFGDYQIENLAKVAISLELIHMATLVHDDVIDDANTRRGQKTVKAKWDNKIAMYTGDYILGKALMIVTQFENPKLHTSLANAIVEMCKGEIEQIHDFYRVDIDLKQYLRRIKRKTALLISISAELGAIVSGVADDTVHGLKRFGYFVGMAFQITDDILDFTATAQQLGKPSGSDLKQGNITLPTIYALQHSKDHIQLRDWIEKQQVEPNIQDILQIIRASGGIEYSQGLAQRYIMKAKHELNLLPVNQVKEQLWNIADFIEKRNF